MKYVILADSKNTSHFETPRQLTEINGEPLVKRTIRLLKENGVKEILVTSHDKRFEGLGAKRYEPLNNYYEHSPIDFHYNKGYWLNGFPEELLTEPICFLFGDVYFSENAIKTIVETLTDTTLFFCTYQNEDKRYIKQHDEPLAYKVNDVELFKEGIRKTKELKDQGVCCREPVVWELYRVIHGQYVNEHKMTDDYIAINDESCDIDSIEDIKKLKIKLGEIKMIKVEALEDFSLRDFNKVEELERKAKAKEGFIFKGDTFKCNEQMCEYLCGKNPLNKAVVQVVEVIPETKKEIKEEPKVEIKEEVAKPKKTPKKKSSKK